MEKRQVTFKKIISALSIKMPKGYSKSLHACVLILSIFGSFMIASASMTTTLTVSNLLGIFQKQFGFFVVSLYLMVNLARKFTWKRFGNKKTLALLCAGMIVFLLLPLATGPISGQYNWVKFGPFTIQPSELAKPFIICLVADALGNLPKLDFKRNGPALKQMTWLDKFNALKDAIAFHVVAVVVMIAIVLFVQKDFGTAMIILLICLMMILMANHYYLRPFQKMLGILFVVGLIFVFILITPIGEPIVSRLGLGNYQVARFKSLYRLFEPEYRFSNSLQQVAGLLAFARGGIGGTGFGTSIQKYGYLPAAQTDYIVAIIIEELGFIGFIIMTLFILWVLFVLFQYAVKIKHAPSRLVLIGVISYCFIHYVFNIGGTSGLLPLTGIPLLLISAGGSSHLAFFGAIGICQNLIARYNTAKPRVQQATEQQGLNK